MTDDRPEPKEAHDRPDLGRTPDALADALSGSDMGSDTLAGSLRGGSASGSDIDPDQVEINRMLAEQGRESARSRSSAPADPETGADAEATPDDDADAATG